MFLLFFVSFYQQVLLILAIPYKGENNSRQNIKRINNFLSFLQNLLSFFLNFDLYLLFFFEYFYLGTFLATELLQCR